MAKAYKEGKNALIADHPPQNEDICELALRILQASAVDPHPDSAAGHLRAALSICAYLAGYEAGDLTLEGEAILLATHGREFGSGGEIGGVNVYADDIESWVVWVCNPMVSTWITVGQLLDEIGDGIQVVEWFGEPFKINEADIQLAASLKVPLFLCEWRRMWSQRGGVKGSQSVA